MKKIISILLTILMTVCCFSPYYAFAEDCKNDDAYFTQEEFESFEHTYAIGITPYTNGLITDRKLGIAKKDATSSTVYGYNKVFWGNNESHSAYSVHFIAKYKMGGVWYTDKSKSIKKGKSCPSTNTSALSVERDWHLKLNPDGGGKYGCEAWGYI